MLIREIGIGDAGDGGGHVRDIGTAQLLFGRSMAFTEQCLSNGMHAQPIACHE
jgi:hypothetical protein